MNSVRKAIFLFLGGSVLYFVTRSPALDEHDSVQLAMGVLDFNMWKDQPHAPGYPVIIFIGWIAHKFCGLGPDLSLHLLSAIGGGLFIAMWFLIVRLQLNERLAWWVALSLIITPAIWMTATKALTDSPAAALLSAEILAAVVASQYRTARPPNGSDTANNDSRINTSIFIAALLGAAAAGVRPQLILVVIVVLATALWQARANARTSILAIVLLIVGGFAWLVPLSYTQWKLQPETSPWTVFPRLAYHQWIWRLDKPGVYLGAGDWSPRYLGTRLTFHLLGWFGLGFGFLRSIPFLVCGTFISLGSLIAYLMVSRRSHRRFWRFHAPWFLTHVAIIFISLSPAQRYYLVVFPLLLVAILQGLLALPQKWNRLALVFPALLLSISIPLAIANHRLEPPALRLVRFVERLYPPTERSNVVLLFNKVRRHAQWYAPDFVTVHDLSPAELKNVADHAAALYTDDSKAELPAGWHRVPLVLFMRSGVIYWKHHTVELYLIDRGEH